MVQVRQLNPKRIYAARLSAGLTQEDLAHRLRNQGIKASARYINRWERGPDLGGNTPRADVVPVLAAALGVSIASLYEESDSDDDEESDPVTDLMRALNRWHDAKTKETA